MLALDKVGASLYQFSSRFQASCDSFCIGDEIAKGATQSLDTVPSGWVPGRFRLSKIAEADKATNQLVQGIVHRNKICVGSLGG